ncbi:LysR substrate-binding domain-containing protein [Amycolatopsis kentuckyensis]|uniref:LysR substrate-binding domain-containing protein n=1 Tax=Amycolatopsis kentuckyensis TaxID=218823 RepID=UPI003561EE6A
MEIIDLRTFLAVARAQGITKAARELHTVQSNVSVRVHTLEKELGAALFRRHARGVVLTAAGERLRSSYAERIIGLAEEAAHVMGDQDNPAGLLSLGSIETTAGLRLPPILGEFTDHHPGIDLSLVTGTTDELTKAVLAGRVEGAFVAGPVPGPGLHAEPVFVEHLVLVSASRVTEVDTALRERPTPRALVFRAGCAYRRSLERILRERGATSVRVTEFGTLEGIVGCVAADMGFTLLPRDLLPRHPTGGRLRAHELPHGDSRAETVFIRRAGSPMTPAMRLFLAHVPSHERRVARLRPQPEESRVG